MSMSNSCTNNEGRKVQRVGFEAILPPVGANDRHQVTVRNTFIDVDDAENSPIIERVRAQTSVSDLLRLMAAEGAQGYEEGESIEPESLHLVGVDCVVDSGQRDEEVLSFEFDKGHSSRKMIRFGDSSDSEDSEERTPLSQDHRDRTERTIKIQNTFITIDEDATTPVGRQGKRAQTWHGRPLRDDTQSTLDDGIELQSETDEDFTPSSFKMTNTPSISSDGSTAMTSTPSISSDGSAAMTSTPSISSDGSTAMTNMPSISSDGSTAMTNTPSMSSDGSTVVGTGCGGVLAAWDVQQCRIALPQQNINSTQPSFSGTTDVMPLYAFPCVPSIAFQAVPATALQSLEIGCPFLPSIGSAGHHKGACKPCAFGKGRCRNGAACDFCHICKPVETKKGGRWILKRRKQAQELMSEALDLQEVLSSAFANVAKNTLA